MTIKRRSGSAYAAAARQVMHRSFIGKQMCASMQSLPARLANADERSKWANTPVGDLELLANPATNGHRCDFFCQVPPDYKKRSA